MTCLGLVIFTAGLGALSAGQAPGMAGYVIPQITGGQDDETGQESIAVSPEMASWFGKAMIAIFKKGSSI